MPVLAGSNITPEYDTLSSQSTLSWPSAFWALVPVAINSMTQASGAVLDLPSWFNFAFRSSPVMCALTALDSMLQIITLSIKQKSFRRGIDDFAASRFRDSSFDDPTNSESSFESLRKNTIFRLGLFLIGVLPQVIKIFACTGVPWTKVWCAAYLSTFIVDEVSMCLASSEIDSQPARVLQFPDLTSPRILTLFLCSIVVWTITGGVMNFMASDVPNDPIKNAKSSLVYLSTTAAVLPLFTMNILLFLRDKYVRIGAATLIISINLAVGLEGYMFVYDPLSTFKPSWTNVLG